MKRRYDGWNIYDRGKGNHPITGRFFATRRGVRIGTTTEEGLIRMIDQKRIDDARPLFGRTITTTAHAATVRGTNPER